MSTVYVSVVLSGFRRLKGFVFNIINKSENILHVYWFILSSSKHYQFNWIRFWRLGIGIIGILAFILDTRIG